MVDKQAASVSAGIGDFTAAYKKRTIETPSNPLTKKNSVEARALNKIVKRKTPTVDWSLSAQYPHSNGAKTLAIDGQANTSPTSDPFRPSWRR